MKRLIYILLILILPLAVSAQSDGTNATHKNVKVNKKSKLKGSVVIGASSFESSAVLTVTSTTQGALMPRMNTTARDNISNPADGLLIFNTSTNQYEFFETTWQTVGGGADGDGIYDGNGSLSGATTVTQGSNTLSFTADPVNAFSIDGATFSVDASNNRVGIGTATPITTFHAKVSTAIGIGTFESTKSGDAFAEVDFKLPGVTFALVNNKFGSDEFFQITQLGSGVSEFTIKKTSGFVGIHTSAPTEMLHVKSGNIRSDGKINYGASG